MKPTYICIKCGAETETFADEQGKWFSCSNEECDNWNKMRREEDGNFGECYKVMP